MLLKMQIAKTENQTNVITELNLESYSRQQILFFIWFQTKPGSHSVGHNIMVHSDKYCVKIILSINEGIMSALNIYLQRVQRCTVLNTTHMHQCILHNNKTLHKTRGKYFAQMFHQRYNISAKSVSINSKWIDTDFSKLHYLTEQTLLNQSK